MCDVIFSYLFFPFGKRNTFLTLSLRTRSRTHSHCVWIQLSPRSIGPGLTVHALWFIKNLFYSSMLASVCIMHKKQHIVNPSECKSLLAPQIHWQIKTASLSPDHQSWTMYSVRREQGGASYTHSDLHTAGKGSALASSVKAPGANHTWWQFPRSASAASLVMWALAGDIGVHPTLWRSQSADVEHMDVDCAFRRYLLYVCAIVTHGSMGIHFLFVWYADARMDSV